MGITSQGINEGLENNGSMREKGAEKINETKKALEILERGR